VNSYPHPDDELELTEEEKLVAHLIILNQRIPGGALIAMPIQLNNSIDTITELFGEHDLPMRDELVTELALWRDHVVQALKFMHDCDRMMQAVIRSVDV
jgi:hypothetical protein